MIDLIGTIRSIYAYLRGVISLLIAYLILKEAGGTIATTGAEQDVYRVETPMGVFEPRKVMIDFTNQTAAETVVLRVYYRIRNGGNYIKKDEVTIVGVPALLLQNIELEPNRHGIRVTMQRTAGGAKDYDWEVFFND